MQLQRAKVLYVQDPNNKSKSFKFDHVWDSMKDYEQWDNTARKPREQCDPEMESPVSPEPGLSSFTINLSDENASGSGGSSSSRRPHGR